MPAPVHPSKPLGSGIRITGAARESLATELGLRYAAGESIRSLANSTGRSYGFVQALLKETGIEFRARGGATRGAWARARQQSSRQAAAAVPRIATELAIGGQPAVADEEAAERARKRAAKAVKAAGHLSAQDILAKPEPEKSKKGGKSTKKAKAAQSKGKGKAKDAKGSSKKGRKKNK